ncbi:hypothetical protein [Wolbachia endosymbiont (group A) of Pogonocherus hispidulus]
MSGHWDDKKGATRMTKKGCYWNDRRMGYLDPRGKRSCNYCA